MPVSPMPSTHKAIMLAVELNRCPLYSCNYHAIFTTWLVYK